MKAIILAAGEGSRLRPLTNEIPKCMVQANGKALVEYQMDVIRQCGISDIVIVKGYKAEVMTYPDVTYRENKRFDSTNMVYSLFCAEDQFDDDIVICYGDIVYEPSILQKLLDDPADFAMSIDLDWLKLWEARNEDPIADAETLKLNADKNIIELGKKPKSLNEIEGQYMGLIKIKAPVLKKVIEFYHQLDKNGVYEGRNLDNMFATTFFQLLIDKGFSVKAVTVNGGWIEVDIPSDLELFDKFLPNLYKTKKI